MILIVGEHEMNKTDRLIGVVGGLLIYETLFCLSAAFSRLCTEKTTQPISQLSYPLVFGFAMLMAVITYQFFRNPQRHVQWLGWAATFVAFLKFLAFSCAGASQQVQAVGVPPWGVLAMSLQVILSPLIIGALCLYLWKMREIPQHGTPPNPHSPSAEGAGGR